MNGKHLATLEYDKIIEQLVAHTAFSASGDLAAELLPSYDRNEVERRLQETTEAKALLATHASVTVGGAHDVRGLARRAALTARLQPQELLDIRTTLVSARSLRYLFMRVADECPLLADKAALIQPLSTVIDEIGRCLDDEGQVQDDASPKLARLRRESAVARQRLLDRLRSIVTSSENARFLQEPIVTERNGRYVIPIRTEFKGRIPGIIHDQSSSGASLFIEPLATLDLNNRWHELQLEERREVERILDELSRIVGHEAEWIDTNVRILAELDFALAKAKYSYEIRAAPAELVDDRWPTTEPNVHLEPAHHPLNLIRARHPLLPRDSVVPIDVFVGGSDTVLLVTGPNTGGKTVALKTVGLLAAMSQAGLHIPAVDGSRLPVFTGIYADIGDEQSIEQSLSTFSSHMSHIVDILDRADADALVLLDELGAGTDPVEGAALAQSLVAALVERRCLVLASSHYSQLKVYAFDTPRVGNASVEFDVETLSPTFRLVIGLPGRSNALAIASKLGLPTEIVERARTSISPADLEADVMLAQVRAARDASEEALEEAKDRRTRVLALEFELSAKLAEIDQTRRRVLDQAREKGRKELRSLRVQVRRLEAALRGDPTESDAALELVREVSASIEDLEKEFAARSPERPLPVVPMHKLELGDIVHVNDLNQTGEVVRFGGDEVEVRVGGFRLRVHPESLTFRSRPDPQAPERETSFRAARRSSPGMELHVRGFGAEQAGPAVDRYLDAAYLAGLPWVHIIHGKGTGVLKKLVREMLGPHPLVASFRPGELSEGGDGVTVATLETLAE